MSWAAYFVLVEIFKKCFANSARATAQSAAQIRLSLALLSEAPFLNGRIRDKNYIGAIYRWDHLRQLCLEWKFVKIRKLVDLN